MPPHRTTSSQRMSLQFLLQDTTPLISPPSSSSSYTPPSSARHQSFRPKTSFPLMLYELAHNPGYGWIRWRPSDDPGRPGNIVELSDWDKLIAIAQLPDYRFAFSKPESAKKNLKEYNFELRTNRRRRQTDGDSTRWSGYYHSSFQPGRRELVETMRRR